MIGDANASCGQYVQAVDDERKARPPHAYPNAVYDINYQAYPSAAEGFLSGANALDPVHSLVGQGTNTQGRMAWLEKYCRTQPLDKFFQALLTFRAELIRSSNH